MATKAKAKKKTAANADDAPAKDNAQSVVVYCKLPSGTSFTMPGGRVVALNGANHKDESGRSLLVFGYGRTEVSEDDWEYISETYGSLKIFDETNPVVFAAETKEDGDAVAKEYSPSVQTGLEQRSPQEIIKKAEKEAGNR